MWGSIIARSLAPKFLPSISHHQNHPEICFKDASLRPSALKEVRGYFPWISLRVCYGKGRKPNKPFFHCGRSQESQPWGPGHLRAAPSFLTDCPLLMGPRTLEAVKCTRMISSKKKGGGQAGSLVSTEAASGEAEAEKGCAEGQTPRIQEKLSQGCIHSKSQSGGRKGWEAVSRCLGLRIQQRTPYKYRDVWRELRTGWGDRPTDWRSERQCVYSREFHFWKGVLELNSVHT